ncbi:MAG: DUF2868 domain-containing protein [Neisseria sp.]|uniref:DUF2868 domain-containing protein n=1 Tax=Neisseria sp. TaxID=192066 RepID=UPI0026DA8A09|nr:DUF2868 domain-containing protein [Neisseria sp.]MDO4248321.1 DUF2868 domain-containing protein [Neisseria sp.]
MIQPSIRLAELVRLLQERGYIFAADPQPITDVLRQAEGSNEEKLIRRAQMIDSDRKLQDTLARVDLTAGWLAAGAAALWLVIGFSGTFGLMQQSGLNFFFLLAGVLGLHTLMLAVWCAAMLIPRRKPAGFLSNPAAWLRGGDPVNQAIVRLYNDQWQQPATRWRLGQAGHRLWLAALAGMLAAALLLLLVRQYTFNWESTLLSDAASVSVVQLLAWLPGLLGFPVPDEQAVLGSRMASSTETARQWGGLLIGSIVCYGIVPRVAAWLVCKIMAKRETAALPLEKPYYQNIIQQWQKRVVDADTQKESIAAVAPKISLNHAAKWAVMLETAWPDAHWFKHILGQEWLDKGCADNRDAVAALKAGLQAEPVQLLIGVRAHTVPDRGVLRQITGLAEAAAGGAVVQLLCGHPAPDGLQESLAQWQQALNGRGLPWLNPPRVSQQERLAGPEE